MPLTVLRPAVQFALSLFLLSLTLKVVTGRPDSEYPRYGQTRHGGSEGAPTSVPAPPYLVSLMSSDGPSAGQHLCSGFLVAPDVVVTAGVCVKDLHSPPQVSRPSPATQGATETSDVFLMWVGAAAESTQDIKETKLAGVALLLIHPEMPCCALSYGPAPVIRSPQRAFQWVSWGSLGLEGQPRIAEAQQRDTVATEACEVQIRGFSPDKNVPPEEVPGVICMNKPTVGACEANLGGPIIFTDKDQEGTAGEAVGVVAEVAIECRAGGLPAGALYVSSLRWLTPEGLASFRRGGSPVSEEVYEPLPLNDPPEDFWSWFGFWVARGSTRGK